MAETLAHCNEFPHDGHEHEGTWEISHGDDWGDEYGIWDDERWIPVRVVVSRWKTKNIPPYLNWVDFSGGPPGTGLTYFREQCPHGVNPRRLHQEEMNLSPSYRGYREEILMHDPVVRGSAQRRIDRLDAMLGDQETLPIIHVVVNGDDYVSGIRAFDVFIKDCQLRPRFYLARYGKNLGTFDALSPTAGVIRTNSAGAVNACGACAAEGEVTITVENSNENDPRRGLLSLGFRGYGWPIPITAVSALPRTAFVIFSTPDRSLLRMPAWAVVDILRETWWRGVKVYPPLP